MSQHTMTQARRREPAWDSADGGALSRIRRHQKHRERLSEAESWILNNKNSSTPTTLASTPSPHKDEQVPMAYLETISSAFGPNADLYELLNVDRHASDREIRIAYFRRGREVLTDHSTPSAPAAMTIGCVSEESKIRFQAVSMAYEILSKPAWRESYEQKTRDDFAVPYAYESRSIPNSPTSMVSAKRSGVRWNEEVEELVFNQDPLEFDASESGVCGDSPREKKKKRKKKKRVVVEDAGLEDHLAKLDEVADKDPFNDFWDDLEASIDGLLSLGSKGSKSSASTTTKESSEELEMVVPPPPKKASPRAATPPPPQQPQEEARSPVATTDKSSFSRSMTEMEGPHDERQASLEPSIGKEEVQKSPGLPQDIVINPQDVEVQPPSNIVFTPRSREYSNTEYDNTDDTTISTMSVTTVGRSSHKSSVRSTPKLEMVSESVFPDVLAEQEGEWANHKSRESLLDKEDGGGATTITKASGASTVSTLDMDLAMCCSDSQASEAPTHYGTESQGGEVTRKDESSSPASEFFYRLYSYMQAFAQEVSHVAEKPSSMFDGVLLEEDDLESFFGILKTELEVSPQDLQ